MLGGFFNRLTVIQWITGIKEIRERKQASEQGNLFLIVGSPLNDVSRNPVLSPITPLAHNPAEDLIGVRPFSSGYVQGIPASVDGGQEQHFFIYLKTDGQLQENSLTPYFNLPDHWKEQFNGVRLNWKDDHSYREYQYVYFGTFNKGRGHDFGNLSLPYANRQGEIGHAILGTT